MFFLNKKIYLKYIIKNMKRIYHNICYNIYEIVARTILSFGIFFDGMFRQILLRIIIRGREKLNNLSKLFQKKIFNDYLKKIYWLKKTKGFPYFIIFKGVSSTVTDIFKYVQKRHFCAKYLPNFCQKSEKNLRKLFFSCDRYLLGIFWRKSGKYSVKI